MLLYLLVFVHPAWFDAFHETLCLCWAPYPGDRQPHHSFHNRRPLILSGASMTRKCQENVKSSVKNRKSLPAGHRSATARGFVKQWLCLTWNNLTWYDSSTVVRNREQRIFLSPSRALDCLRAQPRRIHVGL